MAATTLDVTFFVIHSIVLVNIQKSFPPWAAVVAGSVIIIAGNGLAYYLVPTSAVGYHRVYRSPIRQTSYVPIINEDVHFNLSTVVFIPTLGLFRIVAVDGVELDASLAAPFNGIVKKFPLAHAPQDEPMMVGNQHAQGLHGEGLFFAYFRIAVLHYRSVKVYCYCHFLMELSSFKP